MKEYIHEYLDKDISPEHEKILRNHIGVCPECKQYLGELEKTIALVQSLSHIKAPEHFTDVVMEKLPREKKKVSVKRWFRQHPIFTAAIVFLFLMTTSFLLSWNEDNNFSVTKQENIIIEGNTAIVPKGKVVHGDIIVRNGDIRIDGTVDGNVTVINGEILASQNYLASAGSVTGEIEEINQAFEWLWFQIKNGMNGLKNIFTFQS